MCHLCLYVLYFPPSFLFSYDNIGYDNVLFTSFMADIWNEATALQNSPTNPNKSHFTPIIN